MSSIAALTIGLGISVFVSTYFLLYGPYCGYSYYGCTYSVPGVLAFILPGVWGSIGVRRHTDFTDSLVKKRYLT